MMKDSIFPVGCTLETWSVAIPDTGYYQIGSFIVVPLMCQSMEKFWMPTKIKKEKKATTFSFTFQNVVEDLDTKLGKVAYSA